MDASLQVARPMYFGTFLNGCQKSAGRFQSHCLRQDNLSSTSASQRTHERQCVPRGSAPATRPPQCPGTLWDTRFGCGTSETLTLRTCPGLCVSSRLCLAAGIMQIPPDKSAWTKYYAWLSHDCANLELPRLRLHVLREEDETQNLTTRTELASAAMSWHTPHFQRLAYLRRLLMTYRARAVGC